MPRQTFFNLTKEKRERILDAALDEFAEYHFNDASINRIIDKANISRGSFYQYFDDLEDIYRHIFKMTAELKQNYINENIQDYPHGDLFVTLRSMYKISLQLAKDYPALSKMANHLYTGDKKFKSKILGEWEGYSKQYLASLIKQAQEEGAVRLDLDLDVAVNLFYQMNIAITDQYLSEQDWDTNFQYHLKAADEILKIFEQGVRKIE